MIVKHGFRGIDFLNKNGRKNGGTVLEGNGIMGVWGPV